MAGKIHRTSSWNRIASEKKGRGEGGAVERRRKGRRKDVKREANIYLCACVFAVNKDMSLKGKASAESGQGCGQPAEPTVAGLGVGQLTSS